MSFTLPSNDWNEYFTDTKSELKIIYDKIESYYDECSIYPPISQIFKAFELCSFDNLKVVIIGQDCYHGTGQANGLCFSVDNGVKIPPSLRNILKEMKNDLGDVRQDTDFTSLSEQGVLLLNASLSVLDHSAGSHMHVWQDFTDSLIKYISSKKNKVVFILWGNFAKSKKAFIEDRHCILEGTHPSPLSANRGGFFGGQYFSKANDFLESNGMKSIKWLK
jgi:uracil-DNA glycosylase